MRWTNVEASGTTSWNREITVLCYTHSSVGFKQLTGSSWSSQADQRIVSPKCFLCPSASMSISIEVILSFKFHFCHLLHLHSLVHTLFTFLYLHIMTLLFISNYVVACVEDSDNLCYIRNVECHTTDRLGFISNVSSVNLGREINSCGEETCYMFAMSFPSLFCCSFLI